MSLKRTKIVDIFNPELIGEKVCVKGWVRTRRGNKNVQFVALNDGSTIKNIQIVFDLAKFSEDELKPITTGASLHVEGELVASQGKEQSRFMAQPTPLHTLCRRKDTHLSSCVRLPTCVLAPTLSGQYCVLGTILHLPYTSFSTSVDFSISILR